MALHMVFLYWREDAMREFVDAWARSGKKLNMGKACVRFKKLEDVALDVIGGAFRRLTVRGYIKVYEAALERNSLAAAERSAARKKAAKRGGSGAAASDERKRSTGSKKSASKEAVSRAKREPRSRRTG